jgi:hypothetical protein
VLYIWSNTGESPFSTLSSSCLIRRSGCSFAIRRATFRISIGPCSRSSLRITGNQLTRGKRMREVSLTVGMGRITLLCTRVTHPAISWADWRTSGPTYALRPEFIRP